MRTIKHRKAYGTVRRVLTSASGTPVAIDVSLDGGGTETIDLRRRRGDGSTGSAGFDPSTSDGASWRRRGFAFGVGVRVKVWSREGIGRCFARVGA